ncbi:hypothetical protein LTR86_008338 [Recurvomyces mirabilis]|nr:hypothetical protein LTR86_008338 [Recurvomyces mirabilis]
MQVLSFTSVKETLSGEAVPEIYVCIAVERNARCTRQIKLHDLALAIEFIRKDEATTNLKTTRSIIEWLVCPRHREYTSSGINRHYTRKIEAEWRHEFPLNYFAKPCSPAQPSRLGDTRASPRSSTPDERCHDHVGRPMPSSTQSERSLAIRQSSHSGSPLSRQQRSSSDSRALEASISNIVPQIVADHVGMDPFIIDDTREVQLPSTGPLRDSQVREGPVTPQLGQTPEIGSGQINDCLVPEARAEVNESTVHTRGSSRRRSSPATRTGFEPGEMSKWAPQTTHDEMRDLLGQPLESAKAKGYLYIFPDVNKQYVKIGFTTGKLWDRFRKIEDSCKSVQPLTLDFDSRRSLANIPYIQLLRLEKLVHTDLAHCHRYLHVKSKGRWRTQHEWFEIDPKSAYQTVEYWWDIMKSNEILPGRPLTENFQASLDTGADTVVATVARCMDVDDAWRLAHQNNELRLRKWRAILPDNSRVHHHWVGRKWLVGCVLVFVLSNIGRLVSWSTWNMQMTAFCTSVAVFVTAIEYLTMLMKQSTLTGSAVKAHRLAD